jgi:transcriptional regulator of aromatic amino acid metabolism
MAARVKALGVRPELEVFDTGHLVQVKELIRDGLLDDPVMIQLCMGIAYGAPDDPGTFMALVNQLPPGAVFSAFSISRMQLPFVAMAVLAGGNVRVGLEDNLYSGRGQLATNADLEAKVAKGEFRQDLYYRINVIMLTQPPLRERIGDIPLLAQHYLAEFRTQTGKDVAGFNDQALQMLQRYHWPGNVRELVNVIERAIVLTKRPVIGAEDLPESLRRGATIPEALLARAGGANLKAALANPERQIILDALENNGWNRQDTAEMLGINRTTLYKKMKKYGIQFEKQLNS